MKVIDLQIYRNKKALEAIEHTMADILMSSKDGTAAKLKECFFEWLKKNSAKTG